jgi:hypothetical protein
VSWILPLIAALAVTQAPAGVRGVVVDAATHQPVAGASVLLVRPDALAQAAVTTTDVRGAFVFPTVAPASYRLRAERDDYVRGEWSAPVWVRANQAASDVTLSMIPTAVISGRVTDEHGEPVPKGYVRALTTRVVAEARTNDLGEYRLFGLAPGTYMISAERYGGPSIETNPQTAGRTLSGAVLVTPTPPCPDCPGEGMMQQPVAPLLKTGAFIDPGALSRETYPTMFYPGTTDRSAATPVKAPAGARVEGIDLRLVVVR